MKSSRNRIMLGDKLEQIIKAVTPDVILEKAKEGGCGCSKRKAALNNLF